MRRFEDRRHTIKQKYFVSRTLTENRSTMKTSTVLSDFFIINNNFECVLF